MRIPSRFKDASIDSLNHKQFKCVVDYSRDMDSRVAAGKGLLLCGPPGVGKTWAAIALTRHYVAVGKEQKRYRDVEFVTAPDMFDRYSVFAPTTFDGTFDDGREQPWRDTYERVPWLVINDLGKEYRGGKLDEQVNYKLGRILRARSERNLVTHVTTNLPAKSESGDSLGSVFGSSIVSLLSEMVSVFHIQGPDRRRSG